MDTDGSAKPEMSVTFTADGKTDWEYFWRWQYITPVDYLAGGHTRTNGYWQLIISVDGIPVDSTYHKASDGSNGLLGGDPGCASYFTSSAQGTTPSDGTHTLTLSVVTYNTWAPATNQSGVTIGAMGQVPGLSNAFRARLSHENCILRAAPVPA